MDQKKCLKGYLHNTLCTSRHRFDVLSRFSAKNRCNLMCHTWFLETFYILAVFGHFWPLLTQFITSRGLLWATLSVQSVFRQKFTSENCLRCSGEHLQNSNGYIFRCFGLKNLIWAKNGQKNGQKLTKTTRYGQIGPEIRFPAQNYNRNMYQTFSQPKK